VGQAGGGVRVPARSRQASCRQRRRASRGRDVSPEIGLHPEPRDLILSGELDLENLPEDDEEAIAHLIKIKGIGRWSAEIYLLFAEGRPDVFPAGDLAVMIEIGRLMGLDDKPSEKQLRELAKAWRPYRGAAAVLAWHSYNSAVL